MLEQELRDMWQELKEVWNDSSRTETINFQVSSLIAELQTKVSQFEKDSIKKDIRTIKALTSQFEKDSISKDMKRLTASIRKLIQFLRGKK